MRGIPREQGNAPRGNWLTRDATLKPEPLETMKTEKAENTVTIQFEYTDTFGGEANYSWVRRTELQLPANISDRALVRRAKAWAGLTGCRCTVSNYGDMIDIRPAGSCTVLFVSTVY